MPPCVAAEIEGIGLAVFTDIPPSRQVGQQLGEVVGHADQSVVRNRIRAPHLSLPAKKLIRVLPLLADVQGATRLRLLRAQQLGAARLFCLSSGQHDLFDFYRDDDFLFDLHHLFNLDGDGDFLFDLHHLFNFDGDGDFLLDHLFNFDSDENFLLDDHRRRVLRRAGCEQAEQRQHRQANQNCSQILGLHLLSSLHVCLYTHTDQEYRAAHPVSTAAKGSQEFDSGQCITSSRLRVINSALHAIVFDSRRTTILKRCIVTIGRHKSGVLQLRNLRLQESRGLTVCVVQGNRQQAEPGPPQVASTLVGPLSVRMH